MRAPRPHDLLRVDGLDQHLGDDSPQWVRSALHGTGWVVALPAATPTGHTVCVRGRCHQQRFTTVAPSHCVVDTVSPEDIAGVRAWPTRGTRALQALREVRAPLNHLGLPWGPIGSVGYELVTGLAAVTDDSDLNLLVRLHPFEAHRLETLTALSRGYFENHIARIGCLVDTSRGIVPLSDLSPVGLGQPALP